MPYVKVNDIHMYYEIHGDGEPLLLIVGQCILASRVRKCSRSRVAIYFFS